MIEVPPGDDKLETLLGRDVPSGTAPGVSYQILERIGTGGSSIAFLATRVAPEGRVPVVMKVLRPSIVKLLGERAALVVSKEATSLRRLNEHVPPTPFVVRFIDSGSIQASRHGKTLHLAWIVVEHIHGGPEGTTLTDRVVHSLQTTGAAFDPARAAIAVEHVARGLHAVHEVGVIHRDMKPDNVLVCGSGEDEIFKLADFGIARPQGTATFGAVVGTPGYAGPELQSLDPHAIGPWTDVFGFACVIFFLLTGEAYFPFVSPQEAHGLIKRKERRSILSSNNLSGELRSNADACRAIDLALARATAPVHAERTQSAVALCSELLPHMRSDPRKAGRPSTRRPTNLGQTTGVSRGRWKFSVVHRSVPGFFVRDVAWNTDGRFLAATNRGLSFWDGTAWRDAPVAGFSSPHAIRFVARSGPGAWLVGGEGGTFARYTSEGVRDIVRGDPNTRFDKYAGDLDDLAVFVGSGPGGPQTLFALISHRWAKPLPVAELKSIHGLARVDDTKWLLVGQDTTGQGYTALYNPLDREVERLPSPSARAFFAAGGKVEAGLGLAGGTGGAILVWEAGKAIAETAAGGHDLSAAAVDPLARRWVASAGRIWRRRSSPNARERWSLEWEDKSLSTAIISLLPELGIVRAVMADGAVIEGTTAAI